MKNRVINWIWHEKLYADRNYDLPSVGGYYPIKNTENKTIFKSEFTTPLFNKKENNKIGFQLPWN